MWKTWGVTTPISKAVQRILDKTIRTKLMENEGQADSQACSIHDDVIKWNHFSRSWPFVRGSHRWIPLTKPVTRSVDVFFDLRLNKRLSKQSWGWWFETPSRLFWRHCNVSCPDQGRSWQRTCRRFRIALYLNAQIQVLLHVCVKHVSGSRYVINYLEWVLVGIFINTLNIR